MAESKEKIEDMFYTPASNRAVGDDPVDIGNHGAPGAKSKFYNENGPAIKNNHGPGSTSSGTKDDKSKQGPSTNETEVHPYTKGNTASKYIRSREEIQNVYDNLHPPDPSKCASVDSGILGFFKNEISRLI